MGYFYNIGVALSCLANAILGGDCEQSLSCRIGLSILEKGWMADIPFPNPLRDHFVITALRFKSGKT